MSISNLLGTEEGDRNTKMYYDFRVKSKHKGSCANKPTNCFSRIFASISEILIFYVLLQFYFLNSIQMVLNLNCLGYI